MENLFVCRIAKGHEGGQTKAECPIDFKQNFEVSIKNELKKIELVDLNYDSNNYMDFLHKELWNSGKLRQGWGVDGLNLIDVKNNKSDKERWIKNYIIALKKYWNIDPLSVNSGYSENFLPCHEATGRMNMLADVLLKAKPHDIIFIPKHSYYEHHDENYFTVCEVISNYYFDLNPLYGDFGHTLAVRNIKSYKYNDYNITGMDFTGQHQKGVSQIKDSYKKYNKFRSFIDKYYLPNIKMHN